MWQSQQRAFDTVCDSLFTLRPGDMDVISEEEGEVGEVFDMKQHNVCRFRLLFCCF